ncbi:MAG: response regulator transcription factor [Bacteroidota bacterium]
MLPEGPSETRVLIVEDEVIIADTIARHLKRRGYQVAGFAVSVAEAKTLHKAQQIDIVLIDIRLRGSGTGIDFAQYLVETDHQLPFIYLTSQVDDHHIKAAAATQPTGYLSKPIRPEELYAAIEIALLKPKQLRPVQPAFITLKDRKASYRIKVDNIKYLEVRHVYVHFHLADGRELLRRGSLSETLDSLSTRVFLQTHRGYAVNMNYVSSWNSNEVLVGTDRIPISRNRKADVLRVLEQA